MIFGTEVNSTESRLLGFCQTIELAESRIDDGPIRGQELFKGQVVLKDRMKVLDRLPVHTGFKPDIVIRVELGVGREHPESMKL